jgi:hypothetical protein
MGSRAKIWRLSGDVKKNDELRPKYLRNICGFHQLDGLERGSMAVACSENKINAASIARQANQSQVLHGSNAERENQNS